MEMAAEQRKIELDSLMKEQQRSNNKSTTCPEDKPRIMSILCLMALKRRLWLLPILTSGWLFASFWTSYTIAVSYNHTEVDFPYISHTAIEAPERCVFGQMVNMGAVMLCMNIILRYLFVKRFLLCKQLKVTDKWYKINIAGLVFGILSSFGLSMVANFQTEVQRVPHYFGAFLAFGLGTVYCWLQTSLSYKIHYSFGAKKENKRKWMLMTMQLLNSFVMAIFLVLFATTKSIYKIQHAAGKGTKWGALRGIYLTSTISEWLLALSLLTFMLTYAPTFKNMQVDDPDIRFKPEYESKHSIASKLEQKSADTDFSKPDKEGLSNGHAPRTDNNAIDVNQNM